MGSPPVPKRALNGTPSLALKTPPNCQPLAAQASGPETDLGDGTCQRPLTTKVRRTSKSDKARVSLFKSNQFRLEMEFEKGSPATTPELVSILLPQVKEPCSWMPWLILFAIPT